MGNRTAKFVSAIFASVLAGAPFAAVSQDAPSAPKAADDCLASPKGIAPQGQHWYYRVERGTKRQCWYLRDAPKAAQGVQQDSQQSAQSAAPAPAAKSSRTVQDARAEWRSQPTAPAQDATASIPAQGAAMVSPAAPSRSNAAPDGTAQPPAVASRWPDATAAGPSPAPQVAVGTMVADADPTPQAADSSAPVTQATADAPVGKQTGSLQTLLLVVGGALALAGITGSMIYRFAGARVRMQANEGTRRRINWERELEEVRAPWVEAPKPETSPLPRPRPVDFGGALYRQSKSAPATSHLVADTDDHEAVTPQTEPTALAHGIEDAQPRDASQDAASSAHAEESEADADAVDIDVITAILERLAQEGPRLSQPGAAKSGVTKSGVTRSSLVQSSPATAPAASAQSRQDRSDVRA
jgi:hypothetical protein